MGQCLEKVLKSLFFCLFYLVSLALSRLASLYFNCKNRSRSRWVATWVMWWNCAESDLSRSGSGQDCDMCSGSPALPPASEPVSSPCCLSTLTRMSHHVGGIYITRCPEVSPEHGHGNLIKMWLKKKKTKFEEYLGIKIHFPGRSVRKLLPASEIL